MTTLRSPRGYPAHDRPACSFWAKPSGPIDPKHYGDVMSAWQRGRCAMCGWGRQRLVLDHDHATGMVRGMLCNSCNTAEGTSAHPAMLAYRLGANPAAIVGHVERYYSTFSGWAPTAQEQAERRAADREQARVQVDRLRSEVEAGTADPMSALAYRIMTDAPAD